MLVGLDDIQKQIKNRWQFHCLDISLSWNICASILPCLVIWLSFRWDQSGKSPPKGVNVRIFTVRNSNCGKVMFSQACVKNSVQGGVAQPALGQTPPAGILACTGAYTLPGRQTPLPPTATAADGTHPTGMLSCLFLGPSQTDLIQLKPRKALFCLKGSNK